jgi:hypothetical protein
VRRRFANADRTIVVRRAMCFTFGERAIRRATTAVSASLLHHVSELVRDQPLALRGAGCVSTLAEHDVIAERERARVVPLRRVACIRIRVYLHVAEALAEPAFHLGAQRRGQRPTTAELRRIARWP